MENCKQFIVDVLKQKGAMNVELLLEACITSITNCPKVLKNISHQDLLTFFHHHSDTFIVKQDEICLTQYEEKFQNIIMAEIEKGGCTVTKAKDLLITCDKGTSQYIQAQGKEKGIDDFLTRNNNTFSCINEDISVLVHYKYKEEDDQAIRYFQKVLSDKGSMNITKLAGHWNQAPEAVKKIIKSTNPDVFRNFLLRNSFNFAVKENIVSIQSTASNSLTVEINGNDSECKSVQYFIQKILHHKGQRTLQQLVSCLNLDGTAEIIGTVGSRKKGDIETFLLEHPRIFCIHNDVVTLHSHLRDHSSTKINVISSNSPRIMLNDVTENNQSLDKSSEKVLSKLLGDECVSSIYHSLSSIKLNSFKFVEILWFDVGRKPFIKVLTKTSPMKYVINELHDQPAVTENFLNEMCNNENAIIVSNTSYGVKDSLSTMRLNWMDNSLVGLTLFHQTHSEDAENNFEEKNQGNLRAILYDNINTTSYFRYSYLRRISHKLAENSHVIIVDCHGKLTGYDSILPPEVGKSRRISCSSFNEGSEALMEAVAHDPEVIVTNCLDIMNKDTFQTIKQICEQGVLVVVPIHRNCSELLD